MAMCISVHMFVHTSVSVSVAMHVHVFACIRVCVNACVRACASSSKAWLVLTVAFITRLCLLGSRLFSMSVYMTMPAASLACKHQDTASIQHPKGEVCPCCFSALQ